MKNKIIFKTLMLKGEAGSTIVSMEKTGHVGTADIYTITFNDGSTTEIQLENMSAITSVEKTSSTDTEDIYTITCADGSTQTFSVLNHNADFAAMSEDIDTIDARVDNFINSVVPNTVETLWTGSIQEVGDSATLSKAVSNFDYIDLYLLGSADSKYIRVPATQTAVQIQQQNLSDDASSNFLRLWEMGVSISGTTVSITKSIAWAWDTPGSADPTITANAQNAIPITRIDGVKMASNSPAELVDIRVGADGTTYNSAGAAVRGQINDVNANVNKVVCNNLIGNDTALYPINVASGDKITVSTSDGSIFATDSTLEIYLYLADKSYYSNGTLKNGQSYKTFTINNSNIKYIALNQVPSVPLMCNYGDVVKPYQAYFEPIKAELDEVKNGDFTFADPVFVDGKYINYSTGAIATDAGYKYAEYDITAFRGLHIVGTTSAAPNTVVGIALYDSNMNYISGVNNTIAGKYPLNYDITIPNNASYIRISSRTASENLWTNPVVLKGYTNYQKVIPELIDEINSKVTIVEKNKIIYKRDLSVGNLQAATFVIGDYNENIIYYHKIPVVGGSTVKIETPDIDGVSEKHYRFAQYYASDGSYKTQTADTTNNVYQISSDCGYFAFSMYCKDSNNQAIANLFTILPDDFTINVVYVGDRKEAYTDSNDVNNLVKRAIISENLTHDLYGKLLQAKRPINVSSDAYKSAVQPVVLLHFSDIHADAVELFRMIEIKNMYADLIDDVICTGDIVKSRLSDGIDFWTNTEGAEDILIAIGNHDALTDPTGYDWTQLASQEDQYDRYIAPFVTNWNCVSESDKTYYYKDYAAKKLRLIVINCMLTGTDKTDQLTWLNTVLSGAKTNDYSVVIANHMMIESAEKVDCNFTSLDKSVSGTGNVLTVDYESVVKDFIDGGGKFICYIAGHTHYDMIVKGTTDYTDQLCVVVDALSRNQGNQYSDTQRTNDTDSQDLANLIVFDTASGVIKIIRVGANMDHYLRSKDTITINYSTNEIISQN